LNILEKLKMTFRLPGVAAEEPLQRPSIFLLTWIVSFVGLSAFTVFYCLFAASYNIVPMAGLELVLIISFVFYKRGSLDIAASIMIWSFLAGLFVLATLNDGLHDTSLQALPAFLIAAALLLEKGPLKVFFLACFLSLAALGLLHINHILVYPSSDAVDYKDLFDLLCIDGATIILVALISEFLNKSLAKIRDGAELLSESELRYRDLFNNAGMAIFQTGVKGEVMAVNPGFARMFGFGSPEEVMAEVGNAADIFADRNRRAEIIRIKWERPDLDVFESLYRRKDGSSFLGRLNVHMVNDRNGRLQYIQGFIEDITGPRQAEEDTRRSLTEKEILLRELYHRTKNNMNTIIAMLDLQARLTDDPRLTQAFTVAQDRILSMSLVHERLYKSKDLSRIDLKDYIGDLVSHLSDTYGIADGRISIACELEPVSVMIDSAVPCGMVLNELISNAIKHAFPDDRAGVIRVGLAYDADGLIRLEVADTGVGVPPGFDFRRDGRLGTQAIFSLVERQLDGRVSLDTGEGVAWRFEFRDAQYDPRV